MISGHLSAGDFLPRGKNFPSHLSVPGHCVRDLVKANSISANYVIPVLALQRSSDRSVLDGDFDRRQSQDAPNVVFDVRCPGCCSFVLIEQSIRSNHTRWKTRPNDSGVGISFVRNSRPFTYSPTSTNAPPTSFDS